MPTQITSSGITFNDTTSLTSANGVPSALKLTTARTINGVAFDGTANITVPASGTSAAKAWVNFNGTTSPGTIRSSYNVSSVTKNGTGDYTVNFATPMADANYSVVGSSIITGYGSPSSSGLFGIKMSSSNTYQNKTTSAINITNCNNDSDLLMDAFDVSAAIFGN